MQVALGATDLENLDIILGRMKRDPLLGPMEVELGRAKATRYAIAWCAKHGPERITAAG